MSAKGVFQTRGSVLRGWDGGDGGVPTTHDAADPRLERHPEEVDVLCARHAGATEPHPAAGVEALRSPAATAARDRAGTPSRLARRAPLVRTAAGGQRRPLVGVGAGGHRADAP